MILARNRFRETDMLQYILAAAVLAAPLAAQFPGPWERTTPANARMDEALLDRARDYALKSGGSGIVVRGGKLVYSWGDLKQKYDLKSTSKSIGVTALGVAILDGKVRLEDRAAKHHPAFGVPPESNRATGWLEEVTLFHLATQTAGFDKPGGYQPLLFRPGTKWAYSDSGPNWLAECLTLVYKRDMAEVLFERVFTPLGIGREDLFWRRNAYRPHEIDGIPRREFGSGVHANVDAMARIGMLYLREGRIGGRQLLPASFVVMARAPLDRIKDLPVLKEGDYPRASQGYSLLWWNNGSGVMESLPRDMYFSWGLYDSHIIVVPSLDLVVARAGKTLGDGSRNARYARLLPFIEPIVQAARR